MAYNKELGGKMLNQMYHFRMWKVKFKDWRKKLASFNRESWKYTTDDFIDTWAYLKEQGLIRR